MSELNKLLEVITEVKNEMEKIDPSIKERLSYLNESLSENGVIIATKEELDGFTPRKVVSEQTAQRFSMSIPIPRMMPSEAWGDPASQSRQEVDRIFASITRKSGDMKGRVAHVATFLDPAAAVKKAPGGQVTTLLNMMQIIEALQAAVNDFSESAAGFVFEAFMAALTGGAQKTDKVGGTLAIEDFVTADNENVSLKLLGPDTPIHGSFTNLVDYLFIRGGDGVPSIKYLIAYKDSENDAVAKLHFWEFLISRENLVDLMDQTGNSELFGSVGEQIKQHIASHQESDEWKHRMKQLLLQTSGYNQAAGMFVKNLSDEGEFFIPPGSEKDTTKRRRSYELLGKSATESDMRNAAEEAGREAAKSGGPAFQDWLKRLTLTNLPKTKAAREKRFKDLERYWNRGFESVSKEEEVVESYFGAFHESEKKHMKEELLLEGSGGKGKTGGRQFSISRKGMTDVQFIADTTFYGELDMSQDNIDQLVKIYVEKLGDDLMTLLENTKNFSENIGRYFSDEDRTEAAAANRTARDQGKEIVASLEERAKEEIKPE
jgi:hypothetical protein